MGEVSATLCNYPKGAGYYFLRFAVVLILSARGLPAFSIAKNPCPKTRDFFYPVSNIL